MDENVSTETGEKSTTHFEINKRTWGVIALPFIIAVVLILSYYTRFGSCLSDAPAPNTSGDGLEFACLYSFDSDKWGQAGDFFGGILNPLIGLVTVILVVLSIRQNNIALQQNERALNDSTLELKNSNDIMTNQKHLMDFDLKLRLFIDFINKLTDVLNKDLVIHLAGQAPRSLHGEFIAATYADYTRQKKSGNEQIAPIGETGLSAVNSFKIRMHTSFYLLKGVHDIYNSFPEKSEFRNTLELTTLTYIGKTILNAMYVFISEEFKGKENNPLSLNSIEDFIVSSLKISGDKRFIDNLGE